MGYSAWFENFVIHFRNKEAMDALLVFLSSRDADTLEEIHAGITEYAKEVKKIERAVDAIFDNFNKRRDPYQFYQIKSEL